MCSLKMVLHYLELTCDTKQDATMLFRSFWAEYDTAAQQDGKEPCLYANVLDKIFIRAQHKYDPRQWILWVGEGGMTGLKLDVMKKGNE